MQVPTSALFRQGDQWQVFVVSKGRAIQRNIEIGRRSGLQTEVIAGLEVGEEVIIHPNDRVANGVSVSSE